MLPLIQKGGPLMWPLLLLSVFALAIFLERWIFLRRQEISVHEFLTGILNLIRRRRFSEALDRCDDVDGPVKQVVHAALRHHTQPREELRQIVQEVAQLQLPRLEQRLTSLSTIAYIAPLLGLLGTVTGMIATFAAIEQGGGSVTVSELAGGIWESLVTTATGLCIAIPAAAAYNLLVAKVHRLGRDMERAGIEVLHALGEKSQIVDFDPSKAQTQAPTPNRRSSTSLT